MINELNPAIQITVDQYEIYTYTVEATQNLWAMTDSTPGHIADREARLVQQMRDNNTTNPDVGYLLH